MMQLNQGQQYGWQGQAAGALPPPPPPPQQQQQFQPPPPRGPAPPPPPPNGGNCAPQVSLQPHHWQQQQQQQQLGGPMFHPGQQVQHNMAMNQYLQPPLMMHHGHFQHFQQQHQQYQHHESNGMNNNQGIQQMRHNSNQQHQHRQQLSGQPSNNANNKKRKNTSSNNPPSTIAFGTIPTKNNGDGSGKAGTERPSLALPPIKRQRKKDIVPPLEKITIEPTVREPINETERAEVEAWKAERRKHWPSVGNLARKEQEDAARHSRGELVDPSGEDSRKTRLQEILQRQRAMGLSKQAGTEDMLLKLNGNNGGDGGRGQGRGRQGRGGGGGNGGGCLEYSGRGGRGGRGNTRGGRGYSNGRSGGPEYGYQSFIDAGEAPRIDPGLAKWRLRQEEKKDETKDRTLVVDVEAKDGEDMGTVKADAVGADHENKGIEDIEQVNVAEKPVPEEDGDDRHQQQQHATITAAAGRGHGRGRGREGGCDRGRGGHTTGRGGRGRGHRDNNESRRQQQHQRQLRQRSHEKPSLLEKLLAKEIRQDMSYILQAFRFFVMNNFFEGQGDQQQEPQQAEDQIVFPVVAMEAGTALTKTDTTDAVAVAVGNKPTIQDILRNKEGIDIDITDDDEEELSFEDTKGNDEPSLIRIIENESDGDIGDGCPTA
ncbi:hypothetical protein Ndes2437B_g07243 [Nannochloris sp. 'desiccata']